jgi:hypothetical protein
LIARVSPRLAQQGTASAQQISPAIRDEGLEGRLESLFKGGFEIRRAG